MRWSVPAAKPYHPISATNADGTLGYLLGYHAKQYMYHNEGNPQVQGSVMDKSTFTEQNPNPCLRVTPTAHKPVQPAPPMEHVESSKHASPRGSAS